MKRWHLTKSERGKIRRMTLAGKRQSVIARKLGIGRDTVSMWQVRMNLPTKLVTPEGKIMELFQKGMGGYAIAKKLRVSANRVWATAKKFGYVNARCAPTPPENIRKFSEAVRRREDYIIRLARKYGVAICKAKQVAKEILRTARFRPGLSKPALSSDFPQKHFYEKVGNR